MKEPGKPPNSVPIPSAHKAPDRRDEAWSGESWIDVIVGVTVVSVLLSLWILGGPGQKYEEWFGAMFFAFVTGVVGALISLVRPRILLNPLLYSGLWFLGCAVSWGQIAAEYGYSYFKGKVYVAAVECAFMLFMALLLVNGVSVIVHRMCSSQEEPAP